MLNKGLPRSVVRLLLSWYDSTSLKVMFMKNSSRKFGINHGTRQGGILSCALFTAGIIDDLLDELECSGYGCHVNFRFFGALAYADDILLLSPSISGLNQLLKICHNWSRQSNIEFNASKSQAICFGKRRRSAHGQVLSSPQVLLGDQVIPVYDHVTHLGHILANDLDDSQELNRIARAFNRQFNAFFNRFGEIQNTELKKYLPQNCKLRTQLLFNGRSRKI